MVVPANICVAWPSTVGSIPAGWSRETSLDSRYVLGAAAGADTDLATDRGSLTHVHTSPSHTPTQNAHTHDFSAAQNTADNSINTGTVGASGADFSHGHDAKTSASATGTNNGIAITVDPTSNDLSFVEVIWIKSDGSPSVLPANCLAFFASDSLPSGWSRAHGDRYLKGATAGGNGGATGGSNTHTHTSPPHTHTQNAHNHSAVASTSANVAAVGKGVGADTVDSLAHTHSVSLNSTTATNQSVTTTLSSTSHEPPFKKLNIVTSGSPDLPANIVAIWLGTNAGIPSGWSRLTTMDALWLKGAASNGESGSTTGGGTQHTHTASDCQPLQNSHSHTATGGSSGTTLSAAPGAANTFSLNHQHFPWTVTTDTATNNAVAVSIDLNTANSALPKHRTIIYVQFTGAPTPPARGGVWTSYDVGRFNDGSPEAEILPEIAKKMAQGDLRFVPR